MALNKIRTAVSALVLVLFISLFLGEEKGSVFLSSILLPFQFIPALIRVITEPEWLFIFGLAFLVILSLVFGRVYCSFLCPLGALQDLVIALSRKAGLRRRHAYQKPANGLRYTILIVTTVAFALGSMFLLILLDPYSLTGRIFNHLIEPVVVWLFNTVIDILKSFNIYLFLIETAHIPLSVLAATLVFFVLILILSIRYGRLYCNTVCPVGAFFGLLSRAALFQFSIDKTSCTACDRCERVCKAGCIDTEAAAIDQSRCVGCFNCLDACRKGAIHYRPSWGQSEQQDNWSPARRGFLIASLAAAASLFVALPAGIRNLFGAIRPSQSPPVTPPGSFGVAHFTKACTACHLCVGVCPTKVLIPSTGNHSMPVFMQPVMDYGKSFCEYDCNACGRVCPTGAILPLAIEDKKLVQVGVAELLENECVVYKDKKNCGACIEVCPSHAITTTDKDHVLYPKVEDRYCVGCGACEKACPTNPKSIVVRPHEVHKKAQMYEAETIPSRTTTPADNSFPF